MRHLTPSVSVGYACECEYRSVGQGWKFDDGKISKTGAFALLFRESASNLYGSVLCYLVASGFNSSSLGSVSLVQCLIERTSLKSWTWPMVGGGFSRHHGSQISLRTCGLLQCNLMCSQSSQRGAHAEHESDRVSLSSLYHQRLPNALNGPSRNPRTWSLGKNKKVSLAWRTLRLYLLYEGLIRIEITGWTPSKSKLHETFPVPRPSVRNTRPLLVPPAEGPLTLCIRTHRTKYQKTAHSMYRRLPSRRNKSHQAMQSLRPSPQGLCLSRGRWTQETSSSNTRYF